MTSPRQQIQAYRMHNSAGLQVCVLNYGAILHEICVPRDNGEQLNAVLSYPSVQDYLLDAECIGAIAGRCCNRIANGRFSLVDQTYSLNQNVGNHHLHGGSDGFQYRFWQVLEHSPTRIAMRLHSHDGDQGYPGNVTVDLEYAIDELSLTLSWRAHSDQDTVVNLTNHSYFNLSGESTIGNHRLQINANEFSETTDEFIATGATRCVDGTPLDFRRPRLLSEALSQDHEITNASRGLDQNLVLTAQHGGTPAAILNSAVSGIEMHVFTTQPCIQCYSGNHLTGSKHFHARQGLCLETQAFPNAINNGNAEQVVVRANQTLSHRTEYRFSLISSR